MSEQHKLTLVNKRPVMRTNALKSERSSEHTWEPSPPQISAPVTRYSGVLVVHHWHDDGSSYDCEVRHVEHTPTPPPAIVAYRVTARLRLPYTTQMIERRAAAGLDIPDWMRLENAA